MKDKKNDFFEERDFGNTLGAAINFVIFEIKTFGKLLLIYVFPMFALIQLIQYSLGIDNVNANDLTNIKASPKFFFINLLNFIAYVMFYSLIVSYIKLYITKGKDSFELKEVWDMAASFFSKVAFSQFLFGLLIALGLVLLIIPAIYFAVVSVFVHMIVIFENKSGARAIARCFEIIKDRWWQTFGFLILIFIIIIFIIIVFAAIVVIFPANDNNSAFLIFTNALSIAVSILLISFLEVFITLLYFSYVEKNEHLLLIDRIEKITEISENIDENINSEPEDDTDRFKPKY